MKGSPHVTNKRVDMWFFYMCTHYKFSGNITSEIGESAKRFLEGRDIGTHF